MTKMSYTFKGRGVTGLHRIAGDHPATAAHGGTAAGGTVFMLWSQFYLCNRRMYT